MAGENGTANGTADGTAGGLAADVAPQNEGLAAPESTETLETAEQADEAPEIAGKIGSDGGQEAAAQPSAFDALYGELFPDENAPAARADDEDPLARRRQADAAPTEQASDLDKLIDAAKENYDGDPIYAALKAVASKLKASEAKEQERTQQSTQAEQRAWIAAERSLAMPLLDGLKMPEIFGTPNSRDPRQQKVAEYVSDRLSVAAGALKQIFGKQYPGNDVIAEFVAGVITGKAKPSPKQAAIREIRGTLRQRSTAAGVPASAGKEKPFKITGIEDARTATLNEFDRKYPGVS